MHAGPISAGDGPTDASSEGAVAVDSGEGYVDQEIARLERWLEEASASNKERVDRIRAQHDAWAAEVADQISRLRSAREGLSSSETPDGEAARNEA